MMDIKFRYTLKHKETGLISLVVFNFQEIFDGMCYKLLKHGLYKDYIVLGKGMFTGFKVKKGEVFEGDILEFPLIDGTVDIGVVRFSKDGYWTSQEEGMSEELLSEEIEFYKTTVKVIGTIYQNPELIKPK